MAERTAGQVDFKGSPPELTAGLWQLAPSLS